MTKSRDHHLRADYVIGTLQKLEARIVARFPNAGLTRVCADLVDTARFCARDAARLARPHYLWRFLSLALIAGGVAAQFGAFSLLHVQYEEPTPSNLVQGLDSAVNLLILFGGAVWFVLTLEERAKRRRALDAMHRMRSLVDLIDMDSLTKEQTGLAKSNR